jgi:glycosyltransferase involved in cell wall biosynthesis
MDRKPAQLLVICPIHNEEQNIAYFFARLKKALESLDPAECSYQLLFTNNRSTDRSLSLVEELQNEHDWVGYLTLSRNHGYQLSVLTGMSAIRADLYMVCDVDCEDPPEMLLEFLRAIRAGNDLAYGIRNNRQEPWLLSRFRALFYFSLRTVGDYRIVPYMAEFAMFKRCVRDVVVASQNTAPFLRSEFGYAGFNIVGVPYRREARRHGKTHYNFIGNVRFAIAGILSSTTFPLRAIFYMFPVVSLVNLLVLIGFAIGVVSLSAAAVTLLCVNGIFASGSLAFMSIYLARTYQNGLRRRRFIIDRSLTSLPRSKGPAHASRANAPYATSRTPGSATLDVRA